ncbi:autophagy-related 4b [Brevipalpus obovatus]|uniref:autophagy-related 4b n=1 Tax=Brevipalpus obovatus TaxID=246614 RepID=UPI003D9E65F0
MDAFLRRHCKSTPDNYISSCAKTKTLPVLNSVRMRVEGQDSLPYSSSNTASPIASSHGSNKPQHSSSIRQTYGSHHLTSNHHSSAATYRGSYSGGSSGFQSFGSRDSMIDDRDTNAERVKLKLMSIWNNVKYGWSIKIRASFSTEIPIWLLGESYHTKPGSSYDAAKSNQILEAFKEDFSSRVWLTYRRDFERLPGSLLTSDRGWGCMLRTGQMMLAQAFLNHYLGRDWRWNRTQSDKSGMIHRMIIMWFLDSPNATHSPFSIHTLVRWASILGKKPGDWFGPSSVALLLREALNEAAPSYPILNNICIYVAHDCTIFIQDVIDLCTKTLPHKKSDKLTKEQTHDRFSERNQMSSTSNYHSSNSGSDSKDEQEQGYFTLDRSDSHRASMSSVSRRRSSATTSSSGSSLYGRAMSTINLADTSSSHLCPPPSSHGTNHSQYASSNNSYGSSKQNSSEKPIPQEERWRSVVIIVPVRLGSDTLNPIYAPCIKSLFRHPSCIGIIGGRPKHSLYFVGCQDDKLIYLDPHNDQEAIDADQTDFPLNSYHCDFPRKLPILRMDPSCAIGFYCRTRQEFMDLVDSVGSIIIPQHNKLDYPIFVFSEGSSKNNRIDYDNGYPEKTVRIKHRFIGSLGKIDSEYDADEFVMI